MAGGRYRYIADVDRELGYRPAWPLGTRMRLGDVGPHQRNVFERDKGLAELRVEIDENSDPGGNWGVASRGAVSTSLDGGAGISTGMPAATVASAGAHVELKFGRKHAVFMRAEDVTIRSIENLGEVKDAVLRLDAQGEWRRGWSVVTHLIEAKRCLVLIAKGGQSSATLRLNGDAPLAPGQLATGSAGLSVEKASGMAQHYEVIEPTTPLYKAQRVAWRLPGGKRLVQIGKRGRLRPGRADDGELLLQDGAVAIWEPVRVTDS